MSIIRIGINHAPPYVRLDSNGQIVGGIEGRLFQMFQKHFNFTAIWINIENNYGRRWPNGSWSGMIDEILSDRMDICFAGTALTYNRNKFINYLYPHWIERYTYATLPPIRMNNFDTLRRPFETLVWLSLLAVFVAFFLIDWIYNRLFKIDNHKRVSGKKNINLIFISIRSLLQQSSETQWNQFDNISIKFLNIIWTLSATILVDYYETYLFSMMFMPVIDTIDTIEKLSNYCGTDKAIVMGYNNTFISNALSKSTDPILHTLSKCFEIADDKTGILPWQFLQNSHSKYRCAFLNSESRLTLAYNVLGSEKIYLPPFSEGKSNLFQKFVALPTSRSFQPYYHQFNRFIKNFHSTGLLLSWFQREIMWAKSQYWYYTIYNNNGGGGGGGGGGQDSYQSTLTIDEVEHIFYIYLIGIIISMIFFLKELNQRSIRI